MASGTNLEDKDLGLNVVPSKDGLLSSAANESSERKGQRGISEIDVVVRAGGREKSPVKEVAIPRIGANMTLELPVHLHIKFAANRAVIAPAAGSQDAS